MRISPTAIHESGHCVAARVTGFGAIDRVTLDPPRTYFTDPDAWMYGGRADATSSGLLTRFSDRARWRMAVITLLAGVCAEARVTGEFRVAFRRNRRDRLMVKAFLDGLAGDPDARDALLRDLLHETRRLVERHWDAIFAVARALAISHSLLGHEVERIVRRASIAAVGGQP
jgi:hypothetical protein